MELRELAAHVIGALRASYARSMSLTPITGLWLTYRKTVKSDGVNTAGINLQCSVIQA